MSAPVADQSKLSTALECVQNYPYVWASAVAVVIVIVLVVWYRPLEKFTKKKKGKKSSDASDDDDLSSTMEETIDAINQKQEANKRKK